MKKLLQALTLAFAMYSRIPMPRVAWGAEAMEYVFCFFPLVGVVIGLCELGWFALATWLGVDGLLFAVIALLLGIAITGGIHLDGFCDTCDALGSHQSRERKLEILKDSHIGAFALIGCCCCLLLTVALWDALLLSPATAAAVALIPVLSRTLSGLCCMRIGNARGDGMLITFTDAAAGGRVQGTLLVWLALVAVLLALIGPLYALTVAVGGVLALLLFVPMAKREFGGITGDLAGWFLTVCEVLCLMMLVLGQKVSVLL